MDKHFMLGRRAAAHSISASKQRGKSGKCRAAQPEPGGREESMVVKEGAGQRSEEKGEKVEKVSQGRTLTPEQYARMRSCADVKGRRETRRKMSGCRLKPCCIPRRGQRDKRGEHTGGGRERGRRNTKAEAWRATHAEGRIRRCAAPGGVRRRKGRALRNTRRRACAHDQRGSSQREMPAPTLGE